MTGTSWTIQGIDHEWMLECIPGYKTFYVQGKSRVKNPKHDAYLQQVCNEYEVTFPGRMASWNLAQIGTGGEATEQKIKCIERINNWFSYRAAKNAGNGKKLRDNMMDLTSQTNSRREAAYQAFYRVEGHRLKGDIEADYDKYKAECDAASIKAIPVAARRNKFLAECLKKEPVEVQERIEKERKGAGDNGAARKFFKFTKEAAFIPEEERIANAKLLQMNINKLSRTLDKAADTIEKETGWNVVILVGGPEPNSDGNIHVMSLTTGAIGNVKFEDYYRGWASLEKSFAQFCESNTPEEIREMYVVEPQKPKNVQDCPSTLPTDDRTVDHPQTMPSGISTSESPESTLSNQDFSECPNQSTFTLNDMNLNKSVTPTDVAVAASPNLEITLLMPLTSVPSSTSAPSLACETPPPPSTPPVKDNCSLQDLSGTQVISVSECSTVNALVPTPISTRSTRLSFQKVLTTTAEAKTHWTYNAWLHLKDALANFEGEKLAGLFRDFERELGYLMSNTKANKIDLSSAPKTLKKWVSKGNRDIWSIPTGLSPEEFGSIIRWYCELQPVSRGSSWPLVRSAPKDGSDIKWTNLKKGGPRGFFLELVRDIIWLLESLIEQIVHDKASVSNSRKRKGSTKGGAPAKKQKA